MRGHLKQRSKGSWTIILDIGRDPTTGKRKQKWETIRGTKKEAEKRLAELQHQLDTGTYVQPTKLTVADFLRQWLETYVSSNCRQSTNERYRGVIEDHLIPEYGCRPPVQLKTGSPSGTLRQGVEGRAKEARAA